MRISSRRAAEPARGPRRALLLVSVTTVLVMSGGTAPVHAETPAAGGDSAFLTSLQSVGLSFASNDRAIAAAHAVCGLIDNGEPGLQVVEEVQIDNPGLSLDGAAQFAALAADAYCPQQLKK